MKLTSICILACIFFFTACTNTQPSKPHIHSKKMFQSVDEKDAILVQDGKEKRYCVRCGMDLVHFYKTSHTSSSQDGKK
jgi:thioredoxin-related protein